VVREIRYHWSHFRQYISAIMFSLVYRCKLQQEASQFGMAGHIYPNRNRLHLTKITLVEFYIASKINCIKIIVHWQRSR